jgi:hypothetical protein
MQNFVLKDRRRLRFSWGSPARGTSSDKSQHRVNVRCGLEARGASCGTSRGLPSGPNLPASLVLYYLACHAVVAGGEPAVDRENGSGYPRRLIRR